MHILLTGTSGRLGSHTLLYLLKRNHTITALDLTPLPAPIVAQIAQLPESQRGYTSHICDLADYKALETLLHDVHARQVIDAVIHLGAIPDPLSLDPRVVHNNNVVGSYNVLWTAAALGVTRIVQASSVNATGLSYSPPGHHMFYEMPVTENHPMLPEDPYALSKQICELQAESLVRWHNDLAPPGPSQSSQPSPPPSASSTTTSLSPKKLRIASLRFHMVVPSYSHAIKGTRPQDAFAWVSFDASASACLRAILSEGWEGAEAFNIVAPNICWEGGLTQDEKSMVEQPRKFGTVELMRAFWGDRVRGWDMAWFESPGGDRRSTWDSGKAERMLGWDHDGAAEADL